MRQFLTRRIASALLLLVGLSVVAFGALKLLPGDPAETLVGSSSDPAVIAAARAELKLDRSFPEQYVSYVGNALQGDLGQSYVNRKPVSTLIGGPLSLSLKLMVFAQVLSLGLAMPIGILLAYRAGSRVDRGANAVAIGMLSIPTFVSGIVMSLVLGLKLHWLPTVYPTEINGVWQQIRALLLPAAAIAFAQVPVYMRILRSDVINTLQEDFIDLARSKGLPNRRVLLRHAVRPSLFSLLTLAGVNVGHLIGGSVIVERVFAVPGAGTTLITAVSQRDYLVAVGSIMVIGAGFVVVNLLVDVLYSILDPRIRMARA